jgi:hypothetical protein
MSLYEYLASLWRTLVPLIVGTLVALGAKAGLDIDSEAVSLWLITAFSGAYYALFRFLEGKVGKQWGWLLGLAAPPQYKEKGEL